MTTFTFRPPWVLASKHDGSPYDIDINFNGDLLSRTDLARAVNALAVELFMEASESTDGPISRLAFRDEPRQMPF